MVPFLSVMKELKNIFFESTPKTPQVDFNCISGDLILSGRSIPENATELYEPLLKWVNEYIQQPRQTTNFRINLEYFNTASSIWLAKLVRALSRMSDSENILFIHLYFSVEEFDSMETEDVKDALSPVVDIINNATISIGIKIYGTDEKGEIIKESMVLI
jgi:SiaC family regulatory phosphoprotein